MSGATWSEEDIAMLCELYSKQLPIFEIAQKLNKTENAVTHKANTLGINKQYIKKNNPLFKAMYQDYDWCYERYINKGMTHEEMADEAGCSLRVMQKWCSEKHGLNARTFKKYKKLSDKQRQLIMFSLLGDGHIDKRKNSPLFIVSHAENQKDYLFWKYNLLKDLCASEPTRYAESIATFGSGHEYECKPFYRFGTRIINDLIPIRSMNKSEIIQELNEFGIIIHLLDDGTRSKSNWSVCIASFTKEEKEAYISICKDRLSLICYMQKDSRYIEFDADSSRRIDSMILETLPNDMDIVKYKIIDKDICSPAKYFFVHTNVEDIGLARYCKTNGHSYEKVKQLMDNNGYNEITESQLLAIIESSDVCD